LATIKEKLQSKSKSYKTASGKTVYVYKTKTGSTSGTAKEISTGKTSSGRSTIGTQNLSEEQTQEATQIYEQEEKSRKLYEQTEKVKAYGGSLEPTYSGMARKGYLISRETADGNILFTNPNTRKQIIAQVEGEKRTTSKKIAGYSDKNKRWESDLYKKESNIALNKALSGGLGIVEDYGYPTKLVPKKEVSTKESINTIKRFF